VNIWVVFLQSLSFHHLFLIILDNLINGTEKYDMKDRDVVFQITYLFYSKCSLLILFDFQSDYIGFSDLNNSPVNLSFLTRELWQSDNGRLKNRQILKVILRNDVSDSLKY
jgi:hypothetical protein